MLCVLCLMSLVHVGYLEHCSFTLTPSFPYPTSVNDLHIGTTCAQVNCEITFSKCYPSVHIRVCGNWDVPDILRWEDMGNCNEIGHIFISQIQQYKYQQPTDEKCVDHDVYVSIAPQECSPSYRASHFVIDYSLFQDIPIVEPTLLSETKYIDLSSIKQHADLGLPMYWVKELEMFLYWNKRKSSFIQLDGEKNILPPECSQDVLDDMSYPIEVAPDKLFLLHNGTISLLTLNTSDSEAELFFVSSLSSHCFSKIKLSGDLVKPQVYAIEDGTNRSIQEISYELSPTEINHINMCTDISSEYKFIEILAIDSSEIKLTIISSNNRFYLLKESPNQATTCAVFPKFADQVATPTRLSDDMSTTSLTISSLYPIQSSSPHILAVGSVVLYSPCFGCVWYVLPVDHGETYQVVTDKLGRYVIQTSQKLYNGYFGDVTEISNEKSVEDRNYVFSHLVSFQQEILIQTNFLEGEDGSIQQQDISYELFEMEDYRSEIAQIQGLLAGIPYNNIKVEVCASHDPLFTRQTTAFWQQENLRQHTHECEGNIIPKQVHLQFKETYSIVVKFSLHQPSSLGIDYLIHKSEVSVNIGNSTLLDVSIDKSVDYISEVVMFKIRFSDVGLAHQAPPGEGLLAVSVAVFPGDLDVIRPFYILLGCPPGIKAVLDLQLDSDITNGIKKTSSERDIRLLYDSFFQPSFMVYDLVANRNVTYNGNYKLDIIGGGTQRAIYTDYFFINSSATPDEQDRNQTEINNSIWLRGDFVTVFNNSCPICNRISWFCSAKSPCQNIFPTESGVASYCFKVRFSTAGVGMRESYCLLEETFEVCVDGIPLGIWHSVIFLIVLLIGSLVFVLLGFVHKYGVRDFLDMFECSKSAKDQESEIDLRREIFLNTHRFSNSKRGAQRMSIVSDIRQLQGGFRNSISSHRTSDGRMSLATVYATSSSNRQSIVHHRNNVSSAQRESVALANQRHSLTADYKRQSLTTNWQQSIRVPHGSPARHTIPKEVNISPKSSNCSSKEPKLSPREPKKSPREIKISPRETTNPKESGGGLFPGSNVLMKRKSMIPPKSPDSL